MPSPLICYLIHLQFLLPHRGIPSIHFPILLWDIFIFLPRYLVNVHLWSTRHNREKTLLKAFQYMHRGSEPVNFFVFVFWKHCNLFICVFLFPPVEGELCVPAGPYTPDNLLFLVLPRGWRFLRFEHTCWSRLSSYLIILRLLEKFPCIVLRSSIAIPH